MTTENESETETQDTTESAPFDRRAFAESLGIRLTPRRPPPVVDDVDEPETDPTRATRVRPGEIANMIGQDYIRTQLTVIVRAARLRGEQAPHVLLYGAPGLGKTTLAKIIAFETDSALKVVEASSVDTVTKMANALGELEKGTVFFIDEIHGLPRKVQELLGVAMEDGRITVSVGQTRQQVSNQTIALESFTLVGATTLAGNLTGPLRDRFGFIGTLDFYEDDELAKIISRASELLPNKISAEGAAELASRSRGTPRVALTLLGQVADFTVTVTQDADTPITAENVHHGLELFDIDIWGMNPTDRKVLRSLCEDHMGGPVGLTRLAASSTIEANTIARVVEPFLLRAGLLRNTTRGRVADPKAFGIFGMKTPPFLQRQIDLEGRK